MPVTGLRMSAMAELSWCCAAPAPLPLGAIEQHKCIDVRNNRLSTWQKPNHSHLLRQAPSRTSRCPPDSTGRSRFRPEEGGSRVLIDLYSPRKLQAAT